MSEGAKDLLIKIGADAQEFQDTISGLGSHIIEMISGINPAVAAVTAIVVGLGVAAVDTAHQYEEATNTIIAKTGASGDALQGLKSDWDAVFKADGAHDAETIAAAIGEVNTRLGLTGDPLQKAAKGFLDLADNLKEQVEPLLVNTTQAMNAWGIAASDTTAIQDKLLVVHQKTGASVTELSSALASGQPILKQWGLSFEESATLLGQFQKNGVDGSAAIGGLQKAIKTLTEAGIAPSKDAFLGLIQDIQNAGSESESNAKAIDIFGRSGAQMAQVIRDGKVDINSFADALANSGGAVEEMDAKTDSFGEKLTQLQRNLTSFLEPFGTVLIEAGKEALDMFNGLFSSTGALSEKFSGLLSFLQPLIDTFQNHYAPVLKDIGTFIAGFLINAIGGLIDILKILWDPILKTGIDLFQTYLLPILNKFYDSIGFLIDKLKGIPGFSQVFKDGADALDKLNPKTEDAKTKTEDLEKSHKALSDTLNQKTTPALGSLTDAVKNATAKKEDLKKAVDVLKDAEKELSDAYDKLQTPALKDVKKALEDVETAKKNVKASADKLKSAEEDLKKTMADTKSTAKDLETAMKNVATAKGNVETSTKSLKNAQDDLKASQQHEKEWNDLVTQTLKDMDKTLKDVTSSVPPFLAQLSSGEAQIKSLADAIGGTDQGKFFGAMAAAQQALKDLGVTSNTTFTETYNAALDNYNKIAQAMQLEGTTVTARDIQVAWAAVLQKKKEMLIANGTDLTTEEQKTLTEIENKWGAHKQNLEGIVKDTNQAINTAIGTLSADLVKTLWEGGGSFGDKALSTLKGLGEAVTTAFITPATKALQSFASDILDDLLHGHFSKIMDDITGLGEGIGKAFGIGGSAAGTAAGAASSGAGAAGSAGGGASSAAGAAASSVTGILTSVFSGISAVTGILSLFGVGEGGQKDRLNNIANDTRYLAWNFDQGGLHEAILDIRNNGKYFLDTSFNGWYQAWLNDTSNIIYEMNDRQKHIDVMNTNMLDRMIDLDTILPEKLDQIIASTPSFTIKNYLDGNEIASMLETRVETNIRKSIG